MGGYVLHLAYTVARSMREWMENVAVISGISWIREPAFRDKAVGVEEIGRRKIRGILIDANSGL